jgi:hypothetical protein
MQILGDGVEGFDAVDVFAATVPIDEAEPAFAGELFKPGSHRQVQVGYMGEDKHRGMMQRESSAEQCLRTAAGARLTKCR